MLTARANETDRVLGLRDVDDVKRDQEDIGHRELAEDFDGKAKICKVNTDEQQDIAIKYGIRSIPTILFFKNGEMVDQMVGAASKDTFAEKLNALI